MTEHYFTETPESAHKPLEFKAEYRGHTLRFQTDSGVFSRTELDKGSAALLKNLPDHITGEVLDMGCGYGAIGLSLKKNNPACNLTMVDINSRAVELAKENARANNIQARVLQGNGFEAVSALQFDYIVTNPPIRAGKQVIYQMFADAAASLTKQGTLVLVIRKKQGAPSAITYLQSLFGSVHVLDKKGGFWIICCSKSLHRNQQKEDRT